MELEVEHLSGIAVITVKDRLVGEESATLISTVSQILDQDTRRFIVDLKPAERIDSDGIGSLIWALTEVAKQGGRLVLVLPSRFFEIKQSPSTPPAHPIFETCQSRDEAIKAVSWRNR